MVDPVESGTRPDTVDSPQLVEQSTAARCESLEPKSLQAVQFHHTRLQATTGAQALAAVGTSVDSFQSSSVDKKKM